MLKYVFCSMSILMCISLLSGYTLPWVKYSDNHVDITMDIFSRTICKTNSTCIRTSPTDMPHSCRLMQISYIFGSVGLIIILVIENLHFCADNDLIKNWKILLISLLSFVLLLLSFILVRPCLNEWAIPIAMTHMFEALVILTLMTFIPMIYYIIYRIVNYMKPFYAISVT